MKDFSYFMSLGISGCLNCGSVFVNRAGLCWQCENRLFENSLPKQLLVDERWGVKCLSLFFWQRDQNKILNRLSQFLKGENKEIAWSYWAYLFVKKLKSNVDSAIILKNVENVVLVPCPNFKGKQDHAYLFCKSLSELLNIPMLEMLRKKTEEKQKSRKKIDRIKNLGKEFEVNQTVFEKITDKNKIEIIFVDDIVTSGATMQSARKILKEVNNFSCFTLINRLDRDKLFLG